LPTLRKARLDDVPSIFKLLSQYVREEVILPRPLPELYENVWEFTVAELGGQIVGCGALRFYSKDLAEIRSLCVNPARKTAGVGRALTRQLLQEAKAYGAKTAFALTVVPGFFAKMGFYPAERGDLPQKVWRDCLECEKYYRCDEKTLAFDLAKLRHHKASSHAAIRKSRSRRPSLEPVSSGAR
jgi:amino-acid N-acetyltransferase